MPFAARRLPLPDLVLQYERARFEADAEFTVMQTELARSYLARKIEDPDLQAELTPDYPVGCKRPLMSRQWFPTLTRPDVRLVTEPIVEITETGLRTADGEVHEVDTIVYGTGFKANEFLSTIEVIGERRTPPPRRLARRRRGLPRAVGGGLPEPLPAVRTRTPTA